MSDEELSDNANDDDIVRSHEEDDDGANDQDGNESAGEVKDDDNNEGDVNNGEKVDPPKKKIVRKMYVLNSERLKGPKGVHTIEKLYEGFKFQGKGHEKEDLDRVMKRLEYWAFRLFPKLDFDDFLAKCEHLGYKKDLQVHLKKYRMGIISADDVMNTNNDIVEDEEERENAPGAVTAENDLLAQITNDDEFQRLFDEIDRTTEPIV